MKLARAEACITMQEKEKNGSIAASSFSHLEKREEGSSTSHRLSGEPNSTRNDETSEGKDCSGDSRDVSRKAPIAVLLTRREVFPKR